MVKLTYDPAEITLREILEIFFVIHDPTTLNRQGNDAGTQYRSGIYYETPEQKEVADDFIREASQDKTFGKPIVTEVLPLANYWPAESYHQDYFENNPNQGYCAFVVGPKVEKFRKTFASKVKGLSRVFKPNWPVVQAAYAQAAIKIEVANEAGALLELPVPGADDGGGQVGQLACQQWEDALRHAPPRAEAALRGVKAAASGIKNPS